MMWLSVDAGAQLTGLDRRMLLKLLGASAGTIAFAGAANARSISASASHAHESLSAALREQLAHYVIAARFDHLVPVVIGKAKEQIVYFLGRAFASALTPRAQRTVEFASRLGDGSAQASIIGAPSRLPPADAALVNACLLGESLPLTALINDSMHPGVITLPAALAIGELNRVSGRELLLALVLGYEVFGKLTRAAPATRRATSLLASYAATAAAGRLFSLDRERMIDAFSRAASPCFEIAEDVRVELYPALIARNGIFAAHLARVGAQEGRVEPQPEVRFPEFDPSPLPESLDELGYWEIVTTVQRPYRTAGHDSPAVELLLALMQAHRLTRDSIESIHVVLPAVESRLRAMEVASRGPFSPACLACSSVPYSLARVLIDGRIDGARFADDSLVAEPAVARLMQKIYVTFERGRGSRWIRITIRTCDGLTFDRESDFFAYELPPDMWHDWLRSSGKHLLPASQLWELVRVIHDLENIDDVSKLLATATPARPWTCA